MENITAVQNEEDRHFDLIPYQSHQNSINTPVCNYSFFLNSEELQFDTHQSDNQAIKLRRIETLYSPELAVLGGLSAIHTSCTISSRGNNTKEYPVSNFDELIENFLSGQKAANCAKNGTYTRVPSSYINKNCNTEISNYSYARVTRRAQASVIKANFHYNNHNIHQYECHIMEELGYDSKDQLTDRDLDKIVRVTSYLPMFTLTFANSVYKEDIISGVDNLKEWIRDLSECSYFVKKYGKELWKNELIKMAATLELQKENGLHFHVVVTSWILQKEILSNANVVKPILENLWTHGSAQLNDAKLINFYNSGIGINSNEVLASLYVTKGFTDIDAVGIISKDGTTGTIKDFCGSHPMYLLGFGTKAWIDRCSSISYIECHNYSDNMVAYAVRKYIGLPLQVCQTWHGKNGHFYINFNLDTRRNENNGSGAECEAQYINFMHNERTIHAVKSIPDKIEKNNIGKTAKLEFIQKDSENSIENKNVIKKKRKEKKLKVKDCSDLDQSEILFENGNVKYKKKIRASNSELRIEDLNSDVDIDFECIDFECIDFECNEEIQCIQGDFIKDREGYTLITVSTESNTELKNIGIEELAEKYEENLEIYAKDVVKNENSTRKKNRYDKIAKDIKTNKEKRIKFKKFLKDNVIVLVKITVSMCNNVLNGTYDPKLNEKTTNYNNVFDLFNKIGYSYIDTCAILSNLNPAIPYNKAKIA
jgi:hypothetical protein